MANLRIRKLEPEVIRALEDRAKRNRRSVDDEVNEILRIALQEEKEEKANCATPSSPALCWPRTPSSPRAT